MLGRALKNGVSDNPLLDSPYMQQYDVGVSMPPPTGNFFLLTTGDNFILTTGDKLLLAG
jgi:hypothetical protein